MYEIDLEVRHRRRQLVYKTEDDTTTTSTCDTSFSCSEDQLTTIRDDAFLRRLSQESSLPSLKSSITSSTGSSQMSLFLNQLGGGGALASFMTWDRIEEEAGGDQDQIVHLLQNVQHLDDLLPDWSNHVQPFMIQALQTSNGDSVLELHRSWFAKCRSSSEYRALQIGLCQNLVTSIVLADEATNGRQSRVDLAVRMFSDWMQRGLYVHDDRVWTIGCTLWRLLLQQDMTASLRKADPQGIWFSAWIAHLSPDQVRDLILGREDETNNAEGMSLDSTLQWCHTCLSRTGTLLNLNDHAICCFWLSLLDSLLESTRVSRFPWDALSTMNDSTNGRILFVWDLYELLVAAGTQHGKGDERTMLMCANAMDTLLWGCGSGTLYTTLVDKATKLLEQSSKTSPIHHRMQSTLELLQRR